MSILADMNLLGKGYRIIESGWWTMIDEFFEENYDKKEKIKNNKGENKCLNLKKWMHTPLE